MKTQITFGLILGFPIRAVLALGIILIVAVMAGGLMCIRPKTPQKMGLDCCLRDMYNWVFRGETDWLFNFNN